METGLLWMPEFNTNPSRQKLSGISSEIGALKRVLKIELFT